VDRLLEATADVEQTHFWYRGFRRFVRPLLAEATAGIARPRLLDCGCGTGGNLGLLQEYGQATGFDLTRRGLEFARRHGCRRLAQATVTAAPFKGDCFDVVTSFDVLYCLPDEAEALAIAEMYRLVKPGGAAIVNVAALEMLRGDHSILGGEIRRYTTRRLRTALERRGFHVVRATYTNACLFPLVAGVRMWQRLRGLKTNPTRGDFIRPPAVVNTAFSGALAAEAVALRWTNMPIGSSVLCLARK
jgi:SAM-dependent methyltransferase